MYFFLQHEQLCDQVNLFNSGAIKRTIKQERDKLSHNSQRDGYSLHSQNRRGTIQENKENISGKHRTGGNNALYIILKEQPTKNGLIFAENKRSSTQY